MAHTLTLPATYESLQQLQPFIEEAASSLPATVVAQIVLAIHELCTNIIRHAYAGVAGEIYVEAAHEQRWVSFHIRDSAPNAFTPPSKVSAPDPVNLPEGGWGIYIIHQVMSSVEYHRLPDGNEWILKKLLHD